MVLSKFLNKPEYLYTPSAVLKKIFRPTAPNQLFTTRWNTEIVADWKDAIGGSIGLFGIYDLATTELLWRLVKPGNFVLDIGANIGYMTGLCSYCAGTAGTVWAFEPNPLLLNRLKENIDRAPFNNVTLFELGLSDKKSSAKLIIPSNYKRNAGIAYVAPENEETKQRNVGIKLTTLEDVIPENALIDVMKIDVEGHELAVFRGARKLFEKKRIRHIVFEELHKYPSATSQYLSQFGYSIYRLEKTLSRLKLSDPDSRPNYRSSTTNYIATLDPAKVVKAVKEPGYKCMNQSAK